MDQLFALKQLAAAEEALRGSSATASAATVRDLDALKSIASKLSSSLVRVATRGPTAEADPRPVWEYERKGKKKSKRGGGGGGGGSGGGGKKKSRKKSKTKKKETESQWEVFSDDNTAVLESAWEGSAANVTVTEAGRRVAVSLRTEPMVAIVKVKSRNTTVRVRRRIGESTDESPAGAAAWSASSTTAGEISREIGHWLYRDVSPGGIGLRRGPDYPGKRVGDGHAVKNGQIVEISERVVKAVDESNFPHRRAEMTASSRTTLTFLKLADGSGWVFDRTNVAPLMVEYKRGWLNAPAKAYSTEGGTLRVNGGKGGGATKGSMLPRFRVCISDRKSVV
jgi:hypothetical protein